MVTYAERLTCSGAGYVLDKRSMSTKAPPPDQSALLENDLPILKRSWLSTLVRGSREERLGEKELLGIDAIF